ncbi:MAG: twin-arginine translocase TatA/TatE family subunit [Acidimicrobiaceae bacterium]|nr:twin-arginine translocase TatA/TatE family subunit [Acidimicrobiaceae bacterium]
MFNGPEIWIIILLVVVLFGGSRLPKIARNLGKAQSELKKGLAEGIADAQKSDTPKTDTPKSDTK